VDEVNAARNAYIAEIRACETYNMSLLKENNGHERSFDEPQTRPPKKSRLEMDVAVNDERARTELLFKRFCFIIELEKRSVEDQFCWRLFSTDRYLTPAEIICFQELLKFTDLCTNLDYYSKLVRCSLERLFTDVNINPQVIKFIKIASGINTG
jgi:hypothetical protein